MTISEAQFDNEAELQDWTISNLSKFLGDCLFLPSFRITTPSGKHGIPDGFAFNLSKRSWYCIECEILKHGVWPHIAEQVTRFVVALRNPATLKSIRDRLFERVLEEDRASEFGSILSCGVDRLLQQLELFIEGVTPSVAIFIDDTNQDLTDFCNALDVPTEIYRIKKFIVNDVAEYYSPDQNLPAVVTTPSEGDRESVPDYDIIEQLGGGSVISGLGRTKCFSLNDGKRVHIKKSKFHDRHQVYWYGINPSSHAQAENAECTHYVFVLGSEGFVLIPMQVVNDYLQSAYTTENADGSIRHHHVHISPPPDIVLKGYGNAEDVCASDGFQAFD